MADATILMWSLLALVGMVGIAGLIHDRLHQRPASPFHWSDAEHQHAMIMSRYYREFGPPD